MEDVQRIVKSMNYGIIFFLDELTLNTSLSGFIEGTSGFIEGASEKVLLARPVSWLKTLVTKK